MQSPLQPLEAFPTGDSLAGRKGIGPQIFAQLEDRPSSPVPDHVEGHVSRDRGQPAAKGPFALPLETLQRMERADVRVVQNVVGIDAPAQVRIELAEDHRTQRLFEKLEELDFLSMRPSPDGRRVAYSRDGTDGALTVRDLETGETTRLTEERTYDPVWSADGKRIAYVVLEASGLLSPKIIDLETGASMVPAGTEGQPLMPLDWSHDGQTLLCARFAENADSLVAVHLDSGIAQTLVDQGLQRGSTAVFSRDGQYIAYSAFENDNVDVFTMAADGSNKRRITDARGPDVDPLWSPDGNTLIYTGRDGMWSVRIADGQPVEGPVHLRSQPLGQPLVWTPEAGLFYMSSDSVIVFYSVAVDVEAGALVGSPEPLPVWPGQYGRVFNWSPDMQRVVYYEDGSLHVYSLVDGSDLWIRTGLGNYQNLWWSPDEDKIFYVPGGQENRGIYQIDPASGETELLFRPEAYGERFHLSPDGGRALFYRWSGGMQRLDGKRELVLTNLDGSETRVLASEQEEEVGWLTNFARPLFSPDGQQVFFSTSVEVGHSAKLWVAAADGSSRRVVATASSPASHIGTARWHPSGRYILWGESQSRFLVDLETGEKRELPLPEEAIGELMGIWQWSPDGTRIALTGSRGAGPELWSVKNLLSTKPR